jgi:hypothetical protein
MTEEEKRLFASLLFSHKHLWITFEEYRYLQEHPEMDWETVHDRFSEEADEVYQTLADALLEEKPIADSLQTILLQAQLTVGERRKKMKDD